MPKGVYDHTHIVPWNKGMKGFRAGVKHKPESIEKMRQAALGRKQTDAAKAKISAHFKGRPMAEEVKLRIKATMKAKFYKTPEQAAADLAAREARRRFRGSTEYGHWRKKVLETKGYWCGACGEIDASRLTVDHIKPMISHPELALDVDNGRVLCANCHLKAGTHGRAAFGRE